MQRSSGYGDAWFEKNGFHSWEIAINDVNSGGRWLVSQGIADPGIESGPHLPGTGEQQAASP
jgi:hypothetical protein